MVPSFSFMGGKARLRKWLCSLFPKEGNLYLEPFAGLGNVFYSARTELNFQSWQINDLDVSFFNSILEVDLEALPNEVLKEDFLFWKEQNNSVSRVIEPRISFAGKGYKYGYNGTSGTHKGYNGVLYRNKCHQAKLLLQDVNITNLSWDELGIQNLGEQDFIYLDPPYYNTVTPYPNIDHDNLIGTLNNSNCKWAVSGYDNEFYEKNLKYKNRHIKQRNSEIKSSNHKKYKPVVEMLWTNY